MAVYDSKSDKIYGCKEGSFWWFHERGHQEQQIHGIIPELEPWVTYLLWGCLAFLIVQQNKYALWCLLGILGINMYLEVGAWIYALRHYKRVEPKEHKEEDLNT